MAGRVSDRRLATGLGLLALVFWSASNAFTRSLVEEIGPFTLLAVGFGTGGVLLTTLEVVRNRSLRAPFRLPALYWVFCVPSFVGYVGCYASSYHLAPDDGTALILGLVNYLWPMTVLLLSLVFFAFRARLAFLLPGIAASLLGIGAAAFSSSPVRDGSPVDAILAAVQGSPLAFVLMAVAALAWGVYSNATRRFSTRENAALSSLPGGTGSGGVGVLQALAGGLFLAARTWTGEVSHWSPGVVGPLAFLALFICCFGYAFWDFAMRKGDIVLLGAVSYGVPVVATLISCLWLGQPITAGLVVGAVFVVIGALLCRRGISEDPHPLADGDDGL